MKNFKLSRNQICDYTPKEIVKLYLECQLYIGNINYDEFEYEGTKEMLLDGLNSFIKGLEDD